MFSRGTHGPGMKAGAPVDQRVPCLHQLADGLLGALRRLGGATCSFQRLATPEWRGVTCSRGEAGVS